MKRQSQLPRAPFLGRQAGEIILAAALMLAVAAGLIAPGLAGIIARQVTGSSSATRRSVGYDRTYKCDLVDRLASPPQLVVLGGSRAQRFEPLAVEKLTGLSAFNCALQNCRPQDAYAVSRYLFSRAPGVKLHCLYAVQCTTFVDLPMNAGLLYDKRLAQWFPAALVARQKAVAGDPKVRDVLSCNEFSSRGCLLKSPYDEREECGASLSSVLDSYIGSMLPHATGGSGGGSQERLYFRKLLRLYNAHGVKPAIVIMPYHPRALAAFRAVGWQRKLDHLLSYLRALQRRYDFHLLDYTEIGSFGGRAGWFYDGSHIKAENARLILRQAVKAAPECFR